MQPASMAATTKSSRCKEEVRIVRRRVAHSSRDRKGELFEEPARAILIRWAWIRIGCGHAYQVSQTFLWLWIAAADQL